MLTSELAAAWRSLRMRPAFSALVVGVLALGLGCVIYAAGMVNGLVGKPLPFDQPGRLFDAGLVDNDDEPDAGRFDGIDAHRLLQWRDYVGASAEVAGVAVRTINLSDGDRPERHAGASVTANLFAVLGTTPMLGRAFDASDEAPGASSVVILSEQVWRTRYLGDPGIIGREVRVNARAARVVGVMPARFSYPLREQVWIPATVARGQQQEEFAVLLRLAPGSSLEQVRARLDAWFDDAMQRDPETLRSEAQAVGLQPLAHAVVDRGTRALFRVMLIAVALVLAIACANAANLLLTQMASRRQELWLRAALGASRARILLQLGAQTGLLALAALVIALPLAQLLIEATLAGFTTAGDEGPPLWMDFRLDARMVLFACATAAATALVTALLPVLSAGVGQDRGDGARVHSGRGFARISRGLVIVEVALSCALLISAAVMVQAIVRLDRFDLGLDTGRVLTARIALFEGAYPDDAAVRGYMSRLHERLVRDPEVESASISTSLPGLMGNDVDVLERGLPRPVAGLPNVGYSAVDEHFASTLGVRLVQGRLLDARDYAPDARSIVVDETFARRFAPDGDALGRVFRLEGGQGAAREATIVGVVQPIQMDDIDDPILPSVLEPLRGGPRFFSVLVRTRGVPGDYADGLMRAVADVDPDTPAYWVRDYDAVLDEAVVGIRMLSRIFSGLGVVALALAIAGIYGVVAFAVAQRTREIGLRRALGAPDAQVLGSVAARSLWQFVLGAGLGVALGLPLAGLLAAPLAHVIEVEVAAWLPSLLVLAAVALLAIWLPARRALRVDPNVALRHD